MALGLDLMIDPLLIRKDIEQQKTDPCTNNWETHIQDPSI